MIDKDRIATAARNADREVELHSLPVWAVNHDVVLEDLTYVANQRALRGAMHFDGDDPTNRLTGEVRLSDQAALVMTFIQAGWMDGFAAGLTVKEKSEES